MNTTKARQFKKFIGSSADDRIGVGELLEGTEIARNRDGLLYLNIAKAGAPRNWVEVYQVIEVAVKTSLAIVVIDSVAHNSELD